MTDETILKFQIEKETSLGYMLKLSIPMIVTNISFTVMQFVDRFMVSRLGTDELAAVLPAGLMSFVPASFILGLITTVNTFVSQNLGKGHKSKCSNYCWQAIYMGVFSLSITMALMWPIAPWIFKTLGFEPSVVKLQVVYFRIELYAQVFAVFIWSSSQFFMGIHRPVITMWAALVGQTVNIAANYVLIFGKFGFPAMGIAGAAWGTVIGIAVGAVMGMGMFLGNDINKTFNSRKSMQIDFGKMKDLIKIGSPAGFAFMMHVTFFGVILFTLVGKFGSESLAATSAIFSCLNVSVMPVVGLATALTAVVGKSIGAGRKNTAVKQTSLCLKIAIVYMLFMGFCFFVFREKIMAFWSTDSKVVEAGINILICAAIFQIFDAATIIYNGALRGAGDTLWMAFISIACSIVILGGGGIVMVWLLPGIGSLGPWIAFTASIIVAGIANRWRFKSNKWKNINLLKIEPSGVPIETDAIIE